MSDAGRRTLRFASLREAIADAESMLATGYHQQGQWDLAQICDHLAAWMTFPMDGFPRAPLPMRMLLWGLRNTVGRRELERVLSNKEMTVGAPTFRTTVMPANRDSAGAIKRLKRIVTRFETYPGQLHPSPLYGKLTYEQWSSLHLVHSAHHLSFLTHT